MWFEAAWYLALELYQCLLLPYSVVQQRKTCSRHVGLQSHLLGDFIRWLREGIVTLLYWFSEVSPSWEWGYHGRLGRLWKSWAASSQSHSLTWRHCPCRQLVDPATRVHTQEAELVWANLKAPKKTQRGIWHDNDDVQVYLDDRMWRQWQGLDNIIGIFLPVFSFAI